MEPRKIAIIIVGIVVAIVAFILIAKFISWVGGSNDAPELTTSEQVSLAASADTDLVTKITTSGKIINDEDYSSVRISISRNKRSLEIMSGYNNIVTETVSFKNTQAAFESFLLAIELEGFTGSKKGANTDERGYCPTGTRTVYEIVGNEAVEQRLWSGSCSKKVGTFDGDTSAIRRLFEAQIPDYSKLVKGVRL